MVEQLEKVIYGKRPVLQQVVICMLADEINRATPRPQAALLESMAERQVSIEGKTYRLDPPFFVIATQNPVEHEGTFPLPEAQLDRFLMRLSVGYPSAAAEEEMLVRGTAGEPLEEVQQVLSPLVLRQLQERIRQVHVDAEVRRWLVRFIAGTRGNRDLVLGAGPRASQALYRVAQAKTALAGRDFVLPDDVKQLYPAVLCHRVILGAEGRLSKRSPRQVIDEVFGRIPMPVVATHGAASDAAAQPRLR